MFNAINFVLVHNLFIWNMTLDVRYNSSRNWSCLNYVLAPATITNVSSDIKPLLEGTDLQVFCVASGRPIPDITWARIFPSGSVSDVLHRNTTWDFKNISRTDAGTYRCTASNGVGNPVSRTLQVNVECEYM